MDEQKTIEIPRLPYLERIYRTLASGDYICSRCQSATEKENYAALRDNREAYTEYIEQLGYKLHWNEEFGIFFLTDKARADAVKKSVFSNNIGDYLNIVSIIKEFNIDLKPGDTFSTSDFITFFTKDPKSQLWPEIRTKDKRDRDRDNSISARAMDFLRYMRIKGFIDLFPEPSRTHALLKSSYGYLLTYCQKVSERKAMLEANEMNSRMARNDDSEDYNDKDEEIWQD